MEVQRGDVGGYPGADLGGEVAGRRGLTPRARRLLALGAVAWAADVGLFVTCLCWALGVQGLGYTILAFALLAAVTTVGFVAQIVRRLRWVLRAVRVVMAVRR